MGNKDLENLKAMNDEERQLKIAGRNWEEPVDEIGIKLLKKIREDVEED